MFFSVVATVGKCTVPTFGAGVKPQFTLVQIVVQFVLIRRHNLQAIKTKVSCERCAKGRLATPSTFDVTAILCVATATAASLTPRLLPLGHVRVVLFVLRVATETGLHLHVDVDRGARNT